MDFFMSFAALSVQKIVFVVCVRDLCLTDMLKLLLELIRMSRYVKQANTKKSKKKHS